MIQPFINSKLTTREACAALVREFQATGKRVGYTSGVFDLLHAGHVEYLRRARAVCDVLVVGVNSDASVRRLKGPLRPIVAEDSRVEVITALESVDFAFVFDESNNNTNIETLKPDLYLKAADYASKPLSSRALVESYGGEVELIPFRSGLSTSTLIDRIAIRYLDRAQQQVEFLPPAQPAPAIFVDRDGTLIDLVDYLHEPAKLKVIPGALEALKELRERGYRIIVVTNQPGVGLGYFSKEDLFAVNRELLGHAKKAGLLIDKIYFCPHSESEGCRCRKPDTAMVERAVRELNIDLPNSFVVGDMAGDLELGRRVGAKTVLVRTGRGAATESAGVNVDLILDSVATLKDAVPNAPTSGAPPESSVKAVTPLDHVARFAAKLGHDLNNLLGSMRGCGDLMRARMERAFPEGSPIDRQLHILDAAISKGSTLSERLRGFIRPGKLSMERVSLRSCVARTVELLKSQSKLEFDVEFVVMSDPVVSISEFHVSQVLLAICSNSLDAMVSQTERLLLIYLDQIEFPGEPEQGLVAGTYAQLSIVDHGSGLSAKIRARLFEPFVSTKSSAIGEGLGLSLSFAREAMLRHGGLLQVSSMFNVGTNVRLLLPVSVPPNGAPPVAASKN